MKMTIKQAKTMGVVTKGNSKVHGSTFSVNPRVCNVGSKLVNVEGSTCSGCYALKLAKVYPSALASWENNLDLWLNALETDPMAWIESMVTQINKLSENKAKKGEKGAGYHRWFAAGDLPNMDALRAIVEVAKRTPHIKHWLPTREKALVSRFLSTSLEGFPENLNVRLSAAMVDSKPIAIKGVVTSTVHNKESAVGFACPAYEQDGSCGDCTACWSKKVANVSYKKH
jgi:hypothetical protein